MKGCVMRGGTGNCLRGCVMLIGNIRLIASSDEDRFNRVDVAYVMIGM